MIHVENDNARLEGSPLKLLAEAAMAFASAANGFFEVSKEIEDTEEKAKKVTESMLNALFAGIREAAFDKNLNESCSTFEIKRIDCEEEPCEEEENDVPEL